MYRISEVQSKHNVQLGEVRLPVVSMKDSRSSKDNFIETRTKIIVGAIP